MNPKGSTRQIVRAGLACALVICFSCQESDRNSQPVLTHQQMVKAMAEIYLAEQKINRLGVARDSAEVEFNRIKPQVFEKIQISDSVFKRSFDYYMDRPKEMEAIFTALVDSLSLMEQRIESSGK